MYSKQSHKKSGPIPALHFDHCCLRRQFGLPYLQHQRQVIILIFGCFAQKELPLFGAFLSLGILFQESRQAGKTFPRRLFCGCTGHLWAKDLLLGGVFPEQAFERGDLYGNGGAKCLLGQMVCFFVPHLRKHIGEQDLGRRREVALRVRTKK